MNTQPRHPKCRALPVELHPDIQFLPLYHGEGENQRFFCLWSFMWSNPLLCRFRQSWKIPQTQASKGFAAFRLAPSRIPPRHSQSRRATNCATPGYSVFYPAGRILPKQARYQLRYTRIFSFSCMIPCGEEKSKFFVSVGAAVVKPDFARVFQLGNFRRKLLSQRLPGLRFQENG